MTAQISNFTDLNVVLEVIGPVAEITNFTDLEYIGPVVVTQFQGEERTMTIQ
jgi:hypothetical protein